MTEPTNLPRTVPRFGNIQFPRRNCVDQWTPTEKAIADAVDAVERAGASVHLTDAVILLTKAQAKVADHVEGLPEAARPVPDAQDAELLTEKYWCGCVRLARWERCDAHTGLDHDEEPPRQAADRQPPEEEPTTWGTFDRNMMRVGHVYDEKARTDRDCGYFNENVLNSMGPYTVHPLYLHPVPVPVERGEEMT